MREVWVVVAECHRDGIGGAVEQVFERGDILLIRCEHLDDDGVQNPREWVG